MTWKKDFSAYNVLFKCPITKEIGTLIDRIEVIEVNDCHKFCMAKLNCSYVDNGVVSVGGSDIFKPLIYISVDVITKDYDVIPFNVQMTTELCWKKSADDMVRHIISCDDTNKFKTDLSKTLELQAKIITGMLKGSVGNDSQGNPIYV
jgi:hypothetical protein